MAPAIITFVVLFASILVAVSVGMKYYESRRKKQVSEMLHTVAGAPSVAATTKLLRDLEPPKPSLVQQVLNSLNLTQHLKDMLQQAGMLWSPQRLLTVMSVLGVFGVTLGSMAPIMGSHLLGCVVFGSGLGAAPFLLVRRKRSKRMGKMEEQFPEALDFLARSMRAGHAFTISLEMLSEELTDPLGQEIRTLFNEQNLGAPIDIALRNLTERVPLLDVRFFSTSVLLQRQTGGNLSEILTRLAYVIRERFRLKGQVKAASAHGRLTATILTVLPIVTMLALVVVAPGYLSGMAADPDGKKIIAAAVVAQILGNYFIKKIVRIKV